MTIKLAPMPIYCAGCHNQRPELRHVDFDSALDRGYGKVEAVQVSYDDAVFCEECVREGAEILGMSYPKDDEVKALERKLDLAEKMREKAERYAATLEEAIAHQGIRVDHRKRPRERTPVG